MKQGGFTLIELLVVLAIVGLLAGLVPVAFGSLVPSVSTMATARDVAAVLRQARGIAIHENREVTVAVEASTSSYRLDDREPFSVPRHVMIEMDAGGLVGVEPGSRADAESIIRFFPNGSSTGGGVVIDGGSRAYRITVDWLTGRVEIAD